MGNSRKTKEKPFHCCVLGAGGGWPQSGGGESSGVGARPMGFLVFSMVFFHGFLCFLEFFYGFPMLETCGFYGFLWQGFLAVFDTVCQCFSEDIPCHVLLFIPRVFQGYSLCFSAVFPWDFQKLSYVVLLFSYMVFLCFSNDASIKCSYFLDDFPMFFLG